MTALPDLSTLLALILAGTAAAAGWFFKLWQGSKEREKEAERQLQQSEVARRTEKEARARTEEERKQTREAVEETIEQVKRREKRDFGVNR